MYAYTDDQTSRADFTVAILAPGAEEITEEQANSLLHPEPTLAQAHATQIAELAAACQTAIYKGFVSSALGATYTYPTDDKSQLNLAASVTDSLLPNLPANWTTPFMCADSSGVWAMRAHTAAQIQQVGSDGKAFVLKNLQQNAALTAEVSAATTVSAVQAIVWTNPA